MKSSETKLAGVILFEPPVFGDARGYFREAWKEGAYREAGVDVTFCQDNVAFSEGNVLRGLHYQSPHGQAKLVSVLQGAIYDVWVDIRVGSPTFGQWEGVKLSAENGKQIYIPAGFAHGYCALTEKVLMTYKVSDSYHPECEGAVHYADPTLGIDWYVKEPNISEKDKAARNLADIDQSTLPLYEG